MSESSAPAQRSELQLRVVVGLALIGIASGALALGGIAFWLLCVVLALLMMGEWANLAGVPAWARRLGQGALSVPLAIMAPIPGAGPGFLALGPIGAAALLTVIVTRHQRLALGIFYAGLPVLGLLLLRRQGDGVIFTLWAMALVWMCDIGAYFAGRAIGGPKLAPKISPNKTWAGLAGGVLAASLFGAAMHWYFGLPWRLTLATPMLAILAQGGDLYESWLKRCAGVKDSGNILPGHGGVLDRLDGLVPVAPVAAFLAVALPKLYHLIP